MSTLDSEDKDQMIVINDLQWKLLKRLSKPLGLLYS